MLAVLTGGATARAPQQQASMLTMKPELSELSLARIPSWPCQKGQACKVPGYA